MVLTPFNLGQVEPLGPPKAGSVIGVSRDAADRKVSQPKMVTSRTTSLHDF